MRRCTPVRNNSPFVQWLLEQVRARRTTLTALGQQAGLSSGTLRGLVMTPDRRPTLETCLRLARVLDLTDAQVLAEAGLSYTSNTEGLDPERAELMRLYDGLSVLARHRLLAVARALSTEAAG